MSTAQLPIVFLKAKSILLEGSDNASFLFKIHGFDFENHFKQIKKDSLKSILRSIPKIDIEFIKVENKVFNHNLVMIDSHLPKILASLLLLKINFSTHSLASLSKLLQEENPLDYDTKYCYNFYQHKLKSFLFEVILGMNHTNLWMVNEPMKSQYVIPSHDNESFLFNYYNTDNFKNCLFQNTRLEIGSSTHHKFGMLYKDNSDGNYYFKLNLQIRFK